MTKFQLSRADAPWDYPSLGFRADTSTAILDGSTFDPPITTPPDVFWTVYGGGSAETGITRYTFPVVPSSTPAEPNNGSFLTWDIDLNNYGPTSAADFFAVPGVVTATDEAIASRINDDASATAAALYAKFGRVFVPTAATGVSVQAAIDAAAADGGTAYLEDATQYVTDLRTIPGQTAYAAGIWTRSNVTLQGGRGSTLKLMDGATLPVGATQAQIVSTLYTSRQTNIRVLDLDVDANGDNNPTIAIAHGVYTAHTDSAWIVRCRVSGMYGNDSAPPGETFHFDCNYGTNVHYIDCEADGSTATDTATGFSANNSFGVSWVGCVAHDMTHGMGFTHWQSAGVRYSNCHAYRIGAAGFNSERSEGVTFSACVAGSRSPHIELGSQLPGFTDNEDLGCDVGFQIHGSKDVTGVGCVATYCQTGIHIYSNIGISPTLPSESVIFVGSNFRHNTNPVTIDALQVGCAVSQSSADAFGSLNTHADKPLVAYKDTSGDGLGVRENIDGFGTFGKRHQLGGYTVLSIKGGTQPAGGASDATGVAGDIEAAFNVIAEGITSKYKSGAGVTTLADADFQHRPGDGTIATLRDSTTGIAYRATRINGAWVVVPESATLAWKRIQAGRARLDAQAATTTTIHEAGINGSTGAGGALGVFYLDPADYPTHAKLRVRNVVVTNATAPVSTFTAGLYPITPSGGAAAAVTTTLGTVVSGSTAAVATPALTTATRTLSSEFAIPTAGFYTLGLDVAGSMVANSSAMVRVELEVKS